MNIIGREQTILELFPAEQGTLGKLTNGITQAVHRSFENQSMKNPTRAEITRRFEICMKWAKVFRGDLRWGIQRIVDEFDNVLVAELTVKKYEPPKRTTWIPSDGA